MPSVTDQDQGTEAATRALTGVSCAACGHVAVPYQAFGCESCGVADQLRRVPLSGAGTVTASALVRLKTERSADVPFAIAAVVLDDGPFVRGVLRTAVDEPLQGRRVQAAYDGALEDIRFDLIEEARDA